MKFLCLKNWLAELRAPFFTASIVPVLLGTAIAWHVSGRFHPLYFIATLFSGVLLHAGANVANDYFDFKNNCDNINTEYIRPFTGGSRMIQKGLMTPREVLAESIVCYIIAITIGMWLVYECGLTILWLGLIGAFCGFFYSAPPFKFVARGGLGEFVIGLNFGVLMTLGAYFVQTGHLGWVPVVAAIPVAFLIAGVLYINEFPDFNADRSAGKAHLVVRLGREKAAVGYQILLIATYTVIVVSVILKIVPIWGLATLLTLPLAIKAAKVARTHFDEPGRIAPANAATIQLHLFIGLILSASYIISGLL